jgi:uncharacterized protein YggE
VETITPEIVKSTVPGRHRTNLENNKRSFDVISFKTSGRVAALAIVAIGMPAYAGAQGSQVDARSISVTGRGEAWGPPDQAQISAGVQTRAATVVEAAQENQAVIERIMEALEEQGIDEKDIQTANYSIWPEQDHAEPRGPRQMRITGYRVSNVVNVTVDDIEKVGEVLAAVTNAGANSIHGVHFSVEDTAALEQRARGVAMDDARARAASLAELADVELGEVLTISTSTGPGYPIPMMSRRGMEMADAAAPVPGISPGEQSVSVEIHVTFALR